MNEFQVDPRALELIQELRFLSYSPREKKMKFLVTRMDALHDGGHSRGIRTSEIWPSVVEAENHADAVAQVYENHFGKSQNLPLGREFLVVAMIDAEVVIFKPRQDYTISRRPY